MGKDNALWPLDDLVGYRLMPIRRSEAADIADMRQLVSQETRSDIEALSGMLKQGEGEIIKMMLDGFINQHRSRLERMYHKALNDELNTDAFNRHIWRSRGGELLRKPRSRLG